MLSRYWENRYLVHEMVARDIRGRYIGSLLGLFWSVVNPLLQLALYTIVFSMVLQIRLGNGGTSRDFALFLFCALLPWMACQESISRSAQGFLDHSNLIKRAAFPLEVIPLSLVLSALSHQLIATVAFGIILAALNLLKWETMMLLIPLLLIQACLMYGVSLVVACLNVIFRDIGQILNVLFMVFFWLTPIVYPLDRAPSPFQEALGLNPLTHMVNAFRWVLLGEPRVSVLGFTYWMIVSLLLLGTGKWMLKRTRTLLVDLV